MRQLLYIEKVKYRKVKRGPHESLNNELVKEANFDTVVCEISRPKTNIVKINLEQIDVAY